MTEREKLIDLLCEAKKTDPETGSFTEYLADYLLANGVTVQRWIPVTEMLPKKSGEYLVMTKCGLLAVMAYSAAHRKFNADDYIDNANYAITCTHWMPLPEPPKEVTE